MTKESLSLSLKFKRVKSDQLYYDKYQYSASCTLHECWVFRYHTDHASIDARLDKQQEWRANMRQRWPSGYNSFARLDITDQNRVDIHAMADFIQSIKDYKLVIENRTLRFYTNDINVLDAIFNMDFVGEKRYTEVVIDRPKNTVVLRKPKHRLRSYFKETRISAEEKQAIGQFLLNQPGIRIGEGLKSWLDYNHNSYASKYTRDYFFVDYNNESWLTMLALVRPGLIRKTVNIIAK
jgi:hypothetical protein